MQTILADLAVSMSEFKKNPSSILREAQHRPVAVLNHNKTAFYMVTPELFQAMVEELAERDLYRTILSRLAEKTQAIEVDVEVI
ncbi:type II toxin-antitoxin system Phd/YefM family antitoxin [Vogesella fluminis]|uniref:Antitoxin n=1 Tax=Vogesella fluminis TaxID=1069161 RepID=A0ABQ3HEG6_9NEIS|nr:type II toxin-antitoxin system Phd/YefM family antitoxin [Vogesella fluminis]GHD81179.1 antitoxin [Vogesella fluminis]